MFRTKAQRCVAMLALTAGSGSLHAVSVDVAFQPANQTVVLGDTATVDIVISGIDAASQALGAWNVEFSFNSSIVRADLGNIAYNSAQLGDATSADPGSYASTIQVNSQTLNLAQTSFAVPSVLTSEPSSFTLAEIPFFTEATGTSPLMWNLSVNALSDANGLNLPLSSSIDGNITVIAQTAATPEVPPVLLILLPCAAALARKRIVERARQQISDR